MKKINNIIKTFLIMMLVFMSVMSEAQAQSTDSTRLDAKKVAILPIAYVGEGSPMRLLEMRYRLQNIAYLYLKEKAVELKFQDLAETNALLLKSGVTEANYREYTPKELAAILEVEYVVTGMVTQESNGVYKVKNTNRGNSDEYERETRTQTKTTQDMNTQIDLAVYNNKGEQLYTKSRRSVLSDINAYKPGLEYLLKRSPLYKK